MASKTFVLQRICNFAGTEFDPHSDDEVRDILRNKFNVSLPQRRTMDESLASVSSDIEIIGLIREYRSM